MVIDSRHSQGGRQASRAPGKNVVAAAGQVWQSRDSDVHLSKYEKFEAELQELTNMLENASRRLMAYSSDRAVTQLSVPALSRSHAIVPIGLSKCRSTRVLGSRNRGLVRISLAASHCESRWRSIGTSEDRFRVLQREFCQNARRVTFV
ncbi:MAG: hypothetical protein JWQ49_2280 [Edaphobacter sp.]|nr:hypothetical protein [Edaphobacter sp.]